MEAFADLFVSMAGVPAMVALVLTSVTIFLTSDWRLSLTGLLVQYVLVGIALTRFIQVEVAVVKILVGVLVVPILYLSARQIQEVKDTQGTKESRGRFLGMQVGWGAGPLGLPLRLLALMLVALAVIRFFDEYRMLLPVLPGENSTIPTDIAFVAFWLGGIGLIGLVLSGKPLRVAPAIFTLLAAFDLIYAGLEPGLAIVGLLGALTLLSALAFSYLITIDGLSSGLTRQDLRAGPLAEGVSEGASLDEEEAGG
jgi:hypothetical protein